MNKIQNAVNLIGRAGIAPVVRTFENGMKLAKFSLATHETISEVNGKKQLTQWHNVIAWGKKAELIEKFVKKGQMLAVDGKLVNRSWPEQVQLQKQSYHSVFLQKEKHMRHLHDEQELPVPQRR